MFFLFILIINIGDAIFELSGANKITPVDSHAARVHFVRTTNLRTIIRFRNNVCHLKRCYLTRQFSPLASCNAHSGETKLFQVLGYSILSNAFHRQRCGWREIPGFFLSSGRQSSLRWFIPQIDFKTVNAVLSQTFKHEICFENKIRSQLSVVSFQR